jgi:hypothetical protein
VWFGDQFNSRLTCSVSYLYFSVTHLIALRRFWVGTPVKAATRNSFAVFRLVTLTNTSWDNVWYSHYLKCNMLSNLLICITGLDYLFLWHSSIQCWGTTWRTCSVFAESSCLSSLIWLVLLVRIIYSFSFLGSVQQVGTAMTISSYRALFYFHIVNTIVTSSIF